MLRVVGAAEPAAVEAAPSPAKRAKKVAPPPAAEPKPEVSLDGLPLIRVERDADRQFATDTAKLWRLPDLTEWERGFVKGVREHFNRKGEITFKQQCVIDKLFKKYRPNKRKR